MGGKLNPERKAEIATAFTMAATSVLFLALAVQIRDSAGLLSGARLVPVIVTSLMVVFSVIRCFSVHRTPQEQWSPSSTPDYHKWVIAIFALLIYAGILETAGFLVATFALLVVLAPLFGTRKLLANIIASATITVGIWLLFTKIFGSYLPPGTIL